MPPVVVPFVAMPRCIDATLLFLLPTVPPLCCCHGLGLCSKAIDSLWKSHGISNQLITEVKYECKSNKEHCELV
jgi:hypothetical protein